MIAKRRDLLISGCDRLSTSPSCKQSDTSKECSSHGWTNTEDCWQLMEQEEVKRVKSAVADHLANLLRKYFYLYASGRSM